MHTEGSTESKTTNEVARTSPKRALHRSTPVRALNSICRLPPAAGIKSDGHRQSRAPARAIPLQRAPSFSLPRHLPCRKPRSKHSTPQQNQAITESPMPKQFLPQQNSKAAPPCQSNLPSGKSREQQKLPAKTTRPPSRTKEQQKIPCQSNASPSAKPVALKKPQTKAACPPPKPGCGR